MRVVMSGARRISIDQGATKELDLCAAAVLNALALEAGNRLGVRYQGVFPTSRETREIVLATGLPKALGLPLAMPPGFLTFELCRGSNAGDLASVSSEKEIQTNKLANYVDTCLRQHGVSFTDLGKAYLASLAGEILGNAEDHSTQADWWIAAYLRRERASRVGDCHITIFNFGVSISESLHLLPDNATLRVEIETLIREHRRRKNFIRRHFTEENLWTIYALQEGVTRYNDETGLTLGHRGTGTADMIEMFQTLGQTRSLDSKPKMCLLSGRTHITFDGRFRMREEQTVDGETRRIIAFNEENDLFKRPDAGAVRTLRGMFPGTLISLRFYLDEAYLRKIGE